MLKLKLGLKDKDAVVTPTSTEELGIRDDSVNRWDDKKEEEKKTEKKEPTEKVDPEDLLKEDTFIINIQVGSKVTSISAHGLLKLEDSLNNDPDHREIDKHLQMCSFYRYTFFAAAQHLDLQIKGVEMEYKRWLAKAKKEIRKKLSIARKNERETHGLAAKDQASITQEEVLDTILCDDELSKIYIDFNERIDKIRYKYNMMLELRNSLHDRGFHLSGIAERLSQHKRKQEF